MVMESTNYTLAPDFELLGFLDLQNYHTLLFVILLVIYLLILSANITIFTIICATPRLHIPMYFFIAILAVLEVFYTTVTMPKMLVDLLGSKKSISFHGCLLQIYFFHSLGITEACLLTAMAYDRYLVICTPLNYTTVMTTKLCFQLVFGCCACGFVLPLPEIILTSRLPFCQQGRINHIFCDFPPLISLACTDIKTNIMIDFSLHSVVILCPIFLILLSYTKILTVVMKIKSSEGRQKAFSTCASHLIVVLAFFGTITFMYMRLTWIGSLHCDRIIAVVYAFLIPLFNPVIYSLRNKDIRDVI
ncbi:olfactory receptor 6N2-like [Hemicordylus capensis]|uniref:olfactory receptor 6N2-like n=1 Tax=Hemicordylus capensis TaxID=884348 RepID=UPI00230460AB|nr:olfactory receptor 6N2-like [Hemicordylus capensis]XP_053118389.1 olfactory receptor 6N2-like [Hemicordylus capensis]XP_053118390.1 olfactory receptor 6N2-like [Hemicordylus capensis]XP_053118391.1 olfactory receptor 6N2-like [Hemicordylus capensis]